jgi:hypothetical protein
VDPAGAAASAAAQQTQVANMNTGQTLLIASAMIGALLISGEARAETKAWTSEKWTCTDAASSGAARQFSLQEGVLIEQPLGAPRYRLLDNTSYGIIGADYSADLDPMLGFVSIFVSTVMIDRATGHFAMTSSESGRAPVQRTGQCRKSE